MDHYAKLQKGQNIWLIRPRLFNGTSKQGQRISGSTQAGELWCNGFRACFPRQGPEFDPELSHMDFRTMTWLVS